MKTDGLTPQEVLHYGQLGEIEGLHPSVAEYFAKFGSEALRKILVDDDIRAEYSVAFLDSVEALMEKIKGEVRPKALLQIEEELDRLRDTINDH